MNCLIEKIDKSSNDYLPISFFARAIKFDDVNKKVGHVIIYSPQNQKHKPYTSFTVVLKIFPNILTIFSSTLSVGSTNLNYEHENRNEVRLKNCFCRFLLNGFFGFNSGCRSITSGSVISMATTCT